MTAIRAGLTYINWSINNMVKLLMDNMVETLMVATSIGYLLLAVRKAKNHLASCIPSVNTGLFLTGDLDKISISVRAKCVQPAEQLR